MHLKNELVFQFSDSVLIAMEISDAFSAEIDFDDFFKKKISTAYYKLGDDTGSFFKGYMSDSRYKKLRKKVKEDKGIDLVKLKSHDPYILEKLLENDNGKRDVFLDAYLYRTSKYLGKRIFGLEEHSRKVSYTDLFSEIEKEELIREFTNKFLKEDEEESDLYLDSLKI